MSEGHGVNTDSVVGRISETLTGIFGEASPETLFSSPTKVGDDLVITAVAWERAGGFGFGTGHGEDEDGAGGGGAGGGGGGLSQGRPVAVIHVTPNGVNVTPVIDFTKIGVTLLLGLVGVWGALRR